MTLRTESDSAITRLIIVFALLASLAGLTLGFRYYCKHRYAKQLGIDDLLLGISYVCHHHPHPPPYPQIPWHPVSFLTHLPLRMIAHPHRRRHLHRRSLPPRLRSAHLDHPPCHRSHNGSQDRLYRRRFCVLWHRPGQDVHLPDAVQHRPKEMAEMGTGVCGRFGAGDQAVVGHFHLCLVHACPKEVESDGGGDLLGY